MYKYGTTSTKELTEKFDDLFEETYDEDLWVTKKTYRQIDPGLSFKYKYAFQAVEIEDGKLHTSLSLVLLPESFCKAKRKELAEVNGIDEKDLTVADVFGATMAGVVPFASEVIDDNEEVLQVAKDTVATCLCCYDSLRGFSLDRYVNKIGTTGWDLIKEAKGRIKDAIRYTIRKWKKAS